MAAECSVPTGVGGCLTSKAQRTSGKRVGKGCRSRMRVKSVVDSVAGIRHDPRKHGHTAAVTACMVHWGWWLKKKKKKKRDVRTGAGSFGQN